MKKVEFVIGVEFDGTPLIHTIWIPVTNIKRKR
jgi:hypothetical protein